MEKLDFLKNLENVKDGVVAINQPNTPTGTLRRRANSSFYIELGENERIPFEASDATFEDETLTITGKDSDRSSYEINIIKNPDPILCNDQI